MTCFKTHNADLTWSFVHSCECSEQNRDLFLAFIDLTKAFDTVNRDLLWKVLSKFGCPPNVLSILHEFPNSMKANVVVSGRMSDPFDVLVGLKQDCVLAPVIFNLFLVSVTLASPVGFPPDAGVPFIYRLDGSLFNIRRLTAETTVSHEGVFELQYADDATLPAHFAVTLQGSLDMLSAAYRRAGLTVNAKKTEVLSLATNHDSSASPFTVHGDLLVQARELRIWGAY